MCVEIKCSLLCSNTTVYLTLVEMFVLRLISLVAIIPSIPILLDFLRTHYNALDAFSGECADIIAIIPLAQDVDTDEFLSACRARFESLHEDHLDSPRQHPHFDHAKSSAKSHLIILDLDETVLDQSSFIMTRKVFNRGLRTLHWRKRRLVVGVEAPSAPVEAAWARLRYPTDRRTDGQTDGKTTATLSTESGLQRRVELAAGLRLLHRNGQSDLAAGLFAARHPEDPSKFYAADHAIFWEEAIPEHFQLYSVATGERVAEEERVARDVWPNAPVIPIARAIFGNFSHINAIIHAHGPNAMALASAENNEVLPISEHGFMFHQRVGYVRCDFFFRNDYIDELVEGLKEPGVFALQMRNHAYLMTGPAVAHTYLRAHMFEKACEVQLKVMASGSPPHVPENGELDYHRSSYEGYRGCPAYEGKMEWPAFMRQLERSDPGWTMRGLPKSE